MQATFNLTNLLIKLLVVEYAKVKETAATEVDNVCKAQKKGAWIEISRSKVALQKQVIKALPSAIWVQIYMYKKKI